MGIMRIYIDRHKKVTVSRRKCDLKKVEHRDNSEQFIAGLQNNIAQIRKAQDGSVEEKWQTIKTTLRNISECALGYVAKERKEWISNITLDKIYRRRLLKAQIFGGGREFSEQQKSLLSEECRSLGKEEKKSARKDHTGYIGGMAAYAQNAADKSNMKELYDTVRKMFDAPVSRNVLVKDKNGKIIASVQEQLELWKEHFSEVLKSKYPHNINVETAQTCPELQISKRPPSKREIIEAIKAIKRGKAAGMDNIPATILQVDPHLSSEMLCPLFLNIRVRKEERFPKNCKESIIVKIPKKRL
jgi:enamine deaminase RidA (YjgF/YER057c/UK114 family)